MKYAYALFLSLFLCGGAAAQTGPTVITDSFTVAVVYGTDTFETSGGKVLSSIQYVGFGTELPPDIAADIAGDPNFLGPYPKVASFIQAEVPQAALTTDLAWLEQEHIDPGAEETTVFLTSAGGSPLVGVLPDIALPQSTLDKLFPKYAVTTTLPAVSLVVPFGADTYATGVFDTSTNTLYEGNARFDSYELDLISTAVPEPRSFAMMIAGTGMLGFWLRRRRSRFATTAVGARPVGI